VVDDPNETATDKADAQAQPAQAQPASTGTVEQKLLELKNLHDKGLIDEQEYEKHRRNYEEDEISENAQLFKLLSHYDVKSINDVLVNIFYEWSQKVGDFIRDTRDFQYIGPLRFLPDRYEFSFSNKQSGTNDSESSRPDTGSNKTPGNAR